jgi:CHAT domain-containing protein
VADLVIDRALIITNPTGDLPAAHEEGALVRRVLAASGVAVTELPSCTRDEFIAALPRYPLVHFAGHTNYLRTDPASSHFLFSDGPLTVSELQHVELYPGALFVLGSCESAQAGQESNRDNSFGIGATLLLKGARVVIGSNWPARDAASLELADSFYSHLLDQGTVSRALLAARRDAYDSGNLATAWALLTVMGDPFMRCSIGQGAARPGRRTAR